MKIPLTPWRGGPWLIRSFETGAWYRIPQRVYALVVLVGMPMGTLIGGLLAGPANRTASCPTEIHHGWARETTWPDGQAGGFYLARQDAEHILLYRNFFGDPQRTPVTHDGIEVDVQEASLIYYGNQGRWLELQGNDEVLGVHAAPRERRDI